MLSNRSNSNSNLPKYTSFNPNYDTITEDTITKLKDKIVNIDRDTLRDNVLTLKDSRVSSVQSIRYLDHDHSSIHENRDRDQQQSRRKLN